MKLAQLFDSFDALTASIHRDLPSCVRLHAFDARGKLHLAVRGAALSHIGARADLEARLRELLPDEVDGVRLTRVVWHSFSISDTTKTW